MVGFFLNVFWVVFFSSFFLAKNIYLLLYPSQFSLHHDSECEFHHFLISCYVLFLIKLECTFFSYNTAWEVTLLFRCCICVYISAGQSKTSVHMLMECVVVCVSDHAILGHWSFLFIVVFILNIWSCEMPFCVVLFNISVSTNIGRKWCHGTCCTYCPALAYYWNEPFRGQSKTKAILYLRLSLTWPYSSK